MRSVMPAQAGIQFKFDWVPACAGNDAMGAPQETRMKRFGFFGVSILIFE